jgi:hypothetical protein
VLIITGARTGKVEADDTGPDGGMSLISGIHFPWAAKSRLGDTL